MAGRPAVAANNPVFSWILNLPANSLYTDLSSTIFAGLSDVDFGEYGSEDEDDFRLSGA
jgi:hypothetical protein